MPKFLLVLFVLLIIASPSSAEAPQILISEVQITGGPGKTTNDYIKIYNNTDNPFDLDGYRLVKRTKTGTTDTTIKSWTEATPINPRGFYLWANSEDGFAASLQADCSTTATIADDNGLAIRQGANDTGTIIDALAWGAAANALVETAAFPTNPGAGQILKRLNNQDTNNNSLDFILVDPNAPPADPDPLPNNQPTNSGGGANYCQATNDQVVINELLSTPDEDTQEWLELYNNCHLPVQLTDWTITDGAGTVTKLSGVLDKFLVIEAPQGKLNNAGDLITLKDAVGNVINQVLYGSWDGQAGAPAPAKNQSLARIQDGLDTGQAIDWALASQPTKGAANVVDQSPLLPTPVASSSQTLTNLLITEIFPDPAGSDEQDGATNYEFIELFNQSEQTLELKDWRLAVGEQKIYTFDQVVLTAKNYFVLKRARTGLVLNNDQESIKLYQGDSPTAKQTVTYREAPEGLSYNFSTSTKKWAWSTVVTPGQANIIIGPNQAPKLVVDLPELLKVGEVILLDGSDSFDPEGAALSFSWEFNDGLKRDTKSVTKLLTDQDDNVKLTISDGQLSTSQTIKLKNQTKKEAVLTSTAKSQPQVLGAKVAPTNLKTGQLKLTGIVVVPPGLFGSQYFYLAPLDESDKAADTVIQVYSNKKDFPELKQGDYLEVTGELYDISNDTRLKITAAKDITVMDHDYLIMEKRLAIKELKAELHNQLIAVSGQLTEKKGNGFFLDDGSGEIFVDLKTATGLAPKHFIVGHTYQITGLLRQEKGGLKLWPRSNKDIIEETGADGQFLLEKINQTATDTKPTTINNVTEDNKKLWEYLAIASWGATASLLVLLIKKRLPTK